VGAEGQAGTGAGGAARGQGGRHEGLDLPRAELPLPSQAAPGTSRKAAFEQGLGALRPAEVSGQDATPLGTSSFTLAS